MGRPSRFAKILAERDAEPLANVVEMALSLRLADVDVGPDGEKVWREGSDEELLFVGGAWSRKEKAWLEDHRRVFVLRVHRGQEEAARWLARWFRCYLAGDWKGFRRVWSAMLIGGRRSGKSYLAQVALVVYAIANPGANVWAVSPTIDTADELDQELQHLMSPDWYRRDTTQTNRSIVYTLANGSRIILRSSAKEDRLKAGRVDFALLNEAQMVSRGAFTKLRGATADRGGLVLLACNPPDKPVGRWVEEHFNGARSGAVKAEAFQLDPRANPWITYESLADQADELDERTFNREVLGIFEPIGDVAMHAWNDRDNWLDPPAHFVDVTAQVTRELLGRPVAAIIGFDFQLVPHLPAIPMKLYRDPADPTGEPLLWVVDEIVLEDADEHDVLDALEATEVWAPTGRIAGLTYRGWREESDELVTPRYCAAVLDASAWWQDSEHHKGRSSDRVLKSRRWTELYKPQKDSDRNPEITERVKTGNRLLKAKSGRRRLFVAKHCSRTAEALRLWEMKNGVPWRRSTYAHICDAVTYVAFRLFGPPKTKRGKPTYRGDQKFDRARQMRGVFRP